MERTILERMQESKANHGVTFVNYLNNGEVFKDEFYKTRRLEFAKEKSTYDLIGESFYDSTESCARHYDFDTITMDLYLGLIYKAEDHDENGKLKSDAEPINNIVRFYTADVNCYLNGEQTNDYNYGRFNSHQSFIDYDMLVKTSRKNGLIFDGPETFAEFKEAMKSGEPFDIKLVASLLPKQEIGKEEQQEKVEEVVESVEEVKAEEKPKSLIKRFLGF